MQELIEAIRNAVATDATTEQKASGAHACRTILAALDPEPAKRSSSAPLPAPVPTTGVSLEQLLDLAIARLHVIADRRTTQLRESPTTSAGDPPPRAPGTRAPHVTTDPRAPVRRPPR